MDKRQDEMIDQLRANQLVLMYQQSPQATESPKQPKQSKQPTTLNFDEKYYTEFLNTYGSPSASNNDKR